MATDKYLSDNIAGGSQDNSGSGYSSSGSSLGDPLGGALFSGLNPEQARAVRHVGGPLLILAGAGSGKTRVLVHRIAHLIREAGAPPWSILAITFTNKAAKEMKTRVESLLPDESSAIWISTFHTACIRILRRSIDRLGFAPNFMIYDTDDQLSLIKECLRELELSDKLYVPKSVLEQIGRAKDALIAPEQFQAMNAGNYRAAKIGGVYSLYQQKLKRGNALDFDDIILMAVKLLSEHADLLEYYQNRFRYILVDEYQDTNAAQYALVKLLSGKWKNLCVVGDDDQSIYGWRGADISNILGFEKDFVGAAVVKLEQNYRSTQTILEAANSVIGKNERRKAKKLWTDNERGARIGCFDAYNEHDEAQSVAGAMRSMRGTAGARWGDMCVLYRINAQSRAMENALVREGIPYRIVGGFKFFERKEIKDALAYLRLIMNPSDDVSFMRVINVPRRGIGDASVEKLSAFARDQGVSLYRAACRADLAPGLKSAAPKIARFAAMIEDLRRAAASLDVADLLDYVLDRAGIKAMYEAERTDESKARLENVMELKSEILDFEKSFVNDDIFFSDGGIGGVPEYGGEGVAAVAGVDRKAGMYGVDGGNGAFGGDGMFGGGDGAFGGAGAFGGDGAFGGAVAFGGGGAFGVDGADGTYSQNEANGAQAAEPHIGLAEFLMHVTLVSDIDNFEDETDKVSLMTIHSAKGLEFDTVFIVGAEDGVFPGNRAMTDSSQLEEERRLCYVAITRAMKRLFITNARSRTLFGNTSYNKPSRFISDIPRDLVKHDLDCRPDADDAQAGSFGGGGSRVGDAQADGFGGGGSRVGGAKRHVATRTAPFGQSPAKSPTGAWRGVGTGAPMRPAQPPARDIGSGVGAGGAGAASYANGRTYAIGDPVRHKKYGNGTVKRREKDGQDVIIEIEFANAGLKRFIESMVSLRKLSE